MSEPVNGISHKLVAYSLICSLKNSPKSKLFLGLWVEYVSLHKCLSRKTEGLDPTMSWQPAAYYTSRKRCRIPPHFLGTDKLAFLLPSPVLISPGFYAILF
jgi:hypothetical protein